MNGGLCLMFLCVFFFLYVQIVFLLCYIYINQSVICMQTSSTNPQIKIVCTKTQKKPPHLSKYTPSRIFGFLFEIRTCVYVYNTHPENF